MANYEQGIFYKELSLDDRHQVVLDVLSHENGRRISPNCVECGACCMAFDIPQLGKKAGERCQYLTVTDQGQTMCEIYNNRPKDCKDYDCRFEKTTNGKRQRVVELYASKLYLGKDTKTE